jgi:hypothetical protein
MDEADGAESERPGCLAKDTEDYKPDQSALGEALFKFDNDDTNLKLIVKIYPEPSADELTRAITLLIAGLNTRE